MQLSSFVRKMTLARFKYLKCDRAVGMLNGHYGTTFVNKEIGESARKEVRPSALLMRLPFHITTCSDSDDADTTPRSPGQSAHILYFHAIPWGLS